VEDRVYTHDIGIAEELAQDEGGKSGARSTRCVVAKCSAKARSHCTRTGMATLFPLLFPFWRSPSRSHTCVNIPELGYS
jgi:hypothetical protein